MKTIGIIILIIAIIMAVPPLRAKAGKVVVPVLEKLGPVGNVVINPMRKMGAKSKVKHIASLIDGDMQQGKKIPTEQDFQVWLQRRMQDEKGTDPWGQQYWMKSDDDKYIIGSNGPDHTRGSADDIVAEALK